MDLFIAQWYLSSPFKTFPLIFPKSPINFMHLVHGQNLTTLNSCFADKSDLFHADFNIS